MNFFPPPLMAFVFFSFPSQRRLIVTSITWSSGYLSQVDRGWIGSGVSSFIKH